jgi:hypothetical protein
MGKDPENRKDYSDEKQAYAIGGCGEEGRNITQDEIGKGKGGEEECLIPTRPGSR